ncbi:MAG: FKBP-type peptidyl-prolyl cis-trans isomerase [Nitrospina sp.]|jgi:FKBP-type peptidyl-prolyl cis-trans isomerase FkpA|nr:FKBP-type peptidyl-prolyl cis-trans isomerase [Nitrospina sp.]MBT6601199.1 FKBP-type peptidyl-prolyl cis-trans isomerase [Nitrospina sp.]
MSGVKKLLGISIVIFVLFFLGYADADSSQFTKIDVKIGIGKEAVSGKEVSVHYTGWLFDKSSIDNKGIKFDSSRDRPGNFTFPLGAGRVIKGWDQGVLGMKVGGQRTLIIPSSMGYGTRGAGNIIPPNATLIFDIELLGVQ